MTSSSSPARDGILKHFHLDFVTGCSCYLLLCGGAPVTVRSQQVRAMNLIWALSGDALRDKNVAVVGGGAAGLTFAAAAATLGATVHLFETAQLMHLQVGCWHRPLHPEIFTWPEDTAFRPVSHLPLLGWTTGTAHDVAREIVSKFRLVQEHNKNRLHVYENCRAILSRDGQIRAATPKPLPTFQVIVLAVGFGSEYNPYHLPLNSYWRADALDQSFLGTGKPTVVVAGSGDGALIEVLRSCVQRTDQGPFLDQVLALTLRDQTLLDKIKTFDGPDYRRGRGREVEAGYLSLSCKEFSALHEIDKLLCKHLRATSVRWLTREQHPFDWFSLPINRFLVSRLLRLAEEPKGPDLELVRGVSLKAVERWRDYYLVEYEYQSGVLQRIVCQQAVIRKGAERDALSNGKPGPNRSVTSMFENLTSDLVQKLHIFLYDPCKDHRTCNLQAWEPDSDFEKLFPSLKPAFPELMAEFVKPFARPPTRWKGGIEMVYRIRIWLKNVSSHLTVIYELHPEEEGKPIPRVGIGDWHEQWINTMNDYGIRVRTSDGHEWRVGTVLDALNRRYELALEEDASAGAQSTARQNLRATTPDDQTVEETVDEALARIKKQTSLLQLGRVPEPCG